MNEYSLVFFLFLGTSFNIRMPFLSPDIMLLSFLLISGVYKMMVDSHWRGSFMVYDRAAFNKTCYRIVRDKWVIMAG